MTKSDYLRRLATGLASLEKKERNRYLAYYSELIDDRIEEGLSEEAAVAGIEPVDSAVRRIVAEAREQGKIKKGMSVGGIVVISLCGVLLLLFAVYTMYGLFGFNAFGAIGRRDNPPSGMGTVSPGVYVGNGYELQEATFSGSIRSLEFELAASYIEVKPSADDNFYLTYYTGADHPLVLNTNDASDYVVLQDSRIDQYRNYDSNDLWGRNPKTKENTVTLLVPADTSAKLELGTVSGGVTMFRVNVQSDLTVATVSGEITMDSVGCRALLLASVSGNMDLNLIAADSIDAASTSGEIELDNSATGRVTATTVSGDVDLEGTSFTALYCNTVSGDLDGNLLGKPSDYRVSFASMSGRNSLERITGNGDIFIEFASVSGGISMEFGD